MPEKKSFSYLLIGTTLCVIQSLLFLYAALWGFALYYMVFTSLLIHYFSYRHYWQIHTVGKPHSAGDFFFYPIAMFGAYIIPFTLVSWLFIDQYLPQSIAKEVLSNNQWFINYVRNSGFFNISAATQITITFRSFLGGVSEESAILYFHSLASIIGVLNFLLSIPLWLSLGKLLKAFLLKIDLRTNIGISALAMLLWYIGFTEDILSFNEIILPPPHDYLVSTFSKFFASTGITIFSAVIVANILSLKYKWSKK